MLTYIEARDRSCRPHVDLERNTRLIPRDIYANGELQSVHYAVQFHKTDVVTIMPGNRYALRTGGWATPATVDRIFGHSPATWRTLYTKLKRDGGYDRDTDDWYPPTDTSDEWRVAVRPDPNDPEPNEHHNSPTWRAWANRQWIPFYEGIIVDRDGYVLKRIANDYFKAQRRRARDEARHQRALEAHERHLRHLERLRSGYTQRREARTPRFERLAAEIANDIRDARLVLTTNGSLEVEQDAR